MMNIKVKLSIFLSFFYLCLSAQERTVDFQMNEYEKGKGMDGYVEFIGKSGEGFYQLRSDYKREYIQNRLRVNENFYLDLIGDDLKIKKTAEVFFTSAKRKSKTLDQYYKFIIQDADENLWLFYSEDDTKGKMKLYRRLFDATTFSFNEPEFLVEYDKAKDLSWTKKENDLNWSRSKNKEFISIQIYNRKLHANTPLYIEVFDNKMNSKWKLETTIPEEVNKDLDEKLRFSNTDILTNEGNFLILSKTFRIFSDSEDNFKLFSFSDQNKQAIVREVDQKNKYLSYLDAMETKDNKIQLIALFVDEEKPLGYHGVFYQTYDPLTLDIEIDKISEFSLDHKKAFIISGDVNGKKFEKSKLDIKNLKKIETEKKIEIDKITNVVKDYYIHKNGSTSIVIESIFFYDRGENKYVKNGDVKCINVSDTGSINWIKNYDKYQDTRYYLFSGIYNFLYKDDICFIYNNYKKEELMLASINSSGIMKSKKIKSEIGGMGAGQFRYMPFLSQRIKANTFVGLAANYKLSKHQLLKFTIK